MTLSNTKTDGMKYEPLKSRVADKQAVGLKMAEGLGTLTLLWLLVKRHKTAILATGNVVLVLNWAIPAWATIVTSLFK